jgi:carnitine 3-dehydrogenase
MGPFLTWHLTGGEGGMEATLRQFGSKLGKWTTLELPVLTPRLQRKLIEGTRSEAAGRSVRELEAYRDACVGRFMRVKAERSGRRGS